MLELKLTEQELTVLEVVSMAIKQASCMSNSPFFLASLDISQEDRGDRPCANFASYYTVSGSYKCNSGEFTFGVGMTMWERNPIHRWAIADLSVGGMQHAATAESEGYALHVYAEYQSSSRIDLADQARQLRYLASPLSNQLRIGQRIQFWLNDGERHEGSLNHILDNSLIVDLGYKTISPSFNSIVRLWIIED